MMKTILTDIDKWIRENLFNAVPMAIAVIDRKFNIIHANTAFEQMFGLWQNRKCYAVYKGRKSVCKICKSDEAFKDGIPRINDEIGYNKNGRLTRYIQHSMPVKDHSGEIQFIVEIATDITEIELIRQEHQLLFDQVPCNILVINRDFRIVRTNRRLRETLSDIEGEYCYNALKGFDHKCAECTAHQTFSDGEIHSGDHVWTNSRDQEAHMLVTTVPLKEVDGSFNLVMEMAVDVTKTLELEDELKVAYTYMQAVIETALDGILVLDDQGDITIINPAARRIFNLDESQSHITKDQLARMLPDGVLRQVAIGTKYTFLQETVIKTICGDRIPVRLISTRLTSEGRFIGMAFYIQDLREIRKLEFEKLEAERLAAVGQTVAGLAHGLKNVINALEGGIYLLKSGINQSRMDRVSGGMDMLIRNIERVSMFVKEFLTFSKGRKIHVKIEDPATIARDVVDLYAADALTHGIELQCKIPAPIPPAPMDYEGIHECLTNLIGNAIDACNMSENRDGCLVVLRITEQEGTIIFEVTDNGCGMDYEVKQKVFTNFFTTKGLGGTGLGLLTTKKIIQEHGGKIEFTSEPGEGSTFCIRLPRNRLPKFNEPSDS